MWAQLRPRRKEDDNEISNSKILFDHVGTNLVRSSSKKVKVVMVVVVMVSTSVQLICMKRQSNVKSIFNFYPASCMVVACHSTILCWLVARILQFTWTRVLMIFVCKDQEKILIFAKKNLRFFCLLCLPLLFSLLFNHLMLINNIQFNLQLNLALINLYKN